jgi:hypothetical protein
MATTRNSQKSQYDVGSKPPQVTWTFVRGDTASFKVYVTDDLEAPLNIPDWAIEMRIKRPNSIPALINDDASVVMTLLPEADPDDLPGEFTVFLSASQSLALQTGDIFDIQLSTPQDQIVWTVCQGSVIVIEDVTD